MLSASRSNQRRDLISLFTALQPGAEITFEEIYAATELDAKRSADRSMIYAVREHCRDVQGFVIDALPGKGFRRIPDDELAGKILERRQDRIHRQSARGISESVAIGDFDALPIMEQRRVLAHQAVFGALVLASRLDVTRKLAATHEVQQLQQMNPDAVIEAARRIKQ